MNAFRLSGEKAAAVAPAMLRATVAPVLLTMKTWLGVSAVSETMILLPSGEIARTFPGADLFSLTLVETTINPFVPNSPRFVPRYAFLPCRSNNNEFGVAGRPTAFPTVFAGIAMGTRIVTQPSRTPHPVLEANRVELAGVVLFARSEGTRLNSSHLVISYAVFCLKKKKKKNEENRNETDI